MHINEALDSFPDNAPYWGRGYVMFDLTGSRVMDRRDLHLADWDGDGACDSKCLGRGFGKVSEALRADSRSLWLARVLLITLFCTS